MLPTEDQIRRSKEITTTQLHHLLRLSALSPPETQQQEAQMLHDLRAQLHFVKEVQEVNTTGIRPLRRIYDESSEAESEAELNMKSLKDAIAQEQRIGKHHKRIKRRWHSTSVVGELETWDVLGQAPRKIGRFFAVESAEREDS
ncbi:hypothetical protein FH972_023157 [Carpinus fangiana]|uniref:Glutamyl-tRNA amidotransferase complex subunit Gta3 domain-containing protein n=1 Tax=Carpinus fangiana TaxID=176857 RepID=A0A5N6KUD7_9ROSI|nr:hypothetical protein FH972_023157 [Carpinus fangiana]